MKIDIYSWEGLHFGVLSQLGRKEWKMPVWHPPCLEWSWGSGSPDTLAKNNPLTPASNASEILCTYSGWVREGWHHRSCCFSLSLWHWYGPWCCHRWHSVIYSERIFWGWSFTGTAWPEMLWGSYPWRYGKPGLTLTCITCCNWSCSGQAVGILDLLSSLPPRPLYGSAI